MPINLSKTEISEIVSKFYDKSYDESDIDRGVVTEAMVHFAILCEFEVIHKEDLMDLYEQYKQTNWLDRL